MKAKCRCGAVLAFSTDALGRLVERCDGCPYEGAVRRVAEPLPANVRAPRRPPRPAFDPHRFRCGHDRTTANSAYNKRGWFECRECARERTRLSKLRRAVA
jgi:hypothetical protein